ncbi:hypothetical protein M2351_003727 [Azospirillum canadense]|nr:hypothetical protein [Azospirillum canadense]
MLRVLAARFGFDGIAGSFGLASAGEPLSVPLLGRTIHLWVRSRRGSLRGLLLGRFTEPQLPTGATARRVVKGHERWSSGGVGRDGERWIILERLIVALVRHAREGPKRFGGIIHDRREERNTTDRRTVDNRRGPG